MAGLEACHDGGFFGLAMVMAEDVQDAMNDQQGQLVVDRAAVFGGVAGRDGGADRDACGD